MFFNKLVSCVSTKAGVPRGLECGVDSVSCFSVSLFMSTSLHVSSSMKRRHDYEFMIDDDSVEPFSIEISYIFRKRWWETSNPL